MLPDALDQADQGLSFFMVGLKMEHRQGSTEPLAKASCLYLAVSILHPRKPY